MATAPMPAAQAVATLKAAGRTVTRTTRADAALRYGCQTCVYVIDGRGVNLGRLRQLARETLEAQAAQVPPAAQVPAAPDAVIAHLCRKFPVSTPATYRPAVARLQARGVNINPAAVLRELNRGPALPGETTPPPAPSHGEAAPSLPELRADAAAGRPVSLAGLARALAADLATPQPTPDSLRARAVTREAEAARLAAAGEAAPAEAAASHAETLATWADSLTAHPTGEAWAGQPWDPGTPEARARVALQGERVATLWPIAQAVRGAGLPLPGSWASDGPVMAGERTYGQALASLAPEAIRAAAAALAALPPVTAAQARALTLCRQWAVPPQISAQPVGAAG